MSEVRQEMMLVLYVESSRMEKVRPGSNTFCAERRRCIGRQLHLASDILGVHMNLEMALESIYSSIEPRFA